MSKNLELLLKQAKKLLYQLKNDEALAIIQEIEKMNDLSEEERLDLLFIKIRYLLFKGDYDEALHLSLPILNKTDLGTNTSYDRQLKQLNILCLRTNALWRLGRYDEGLKTIQKIEVILEKLSPNESSYYNVKANMLVEKAVILVLKGKLFQSQELFHESLSLYKKYGSLIKVSIAHNYLGLGYKSLGKPDLAIRHYNKCIDICTKIGTIIPMYFAKGNLGIVYMMQGEFNLALESCSEQLRISEERGDKYNIIEGNVDLGRLYRLRGDFDPAFKHFNKALEMWTDLGNNEKVSRILFYLILLNSENNFIEQAQKYLQQLQKINEREENKLIDQRYRFTYTVLLGVKQRMIDLVRAQRMYKLIAKEEIIDDEIMIFTIINLCKLLLKEVQLFGNKDAIHELQYYTRQFFERAKTYNSFVLLTEAYILQSRIALIDWDTRKAKEFLTQATLIAREKNLKKLVLEITRERALLEKRIEIGKKYQLEDSSLKEKVKLAQLDDIISRIVYSESSKIIKQSEELSDFAHQMAHDLKRNITNIIGFGELLKDRGYDERLIRIVINNAKTMSDLLIHSVELAEAGLIVQTVDEVDLNHLVESVALIHLPPDVVLTHNELPIIVCDRNKISQIFKNLFENAVTHGKTTKTISVKRINYTDGIALLVSNDGIPIPTNLSNDIFQRGFSTKKGNTGLGLTIVKKLVEAHGWDISLDPASSTTFKVSIPIRLHTELRVKDKSYA